MTFYPDSSTTFAACTNPSQFLLFNNTNRDYISRLPNELKYGIAQHLSISDLGHLAQTSQFFYDFATPLLYEKDNRYNNQRAIFWASSTNAANISERNLMKVLSLAIQYGGDVNKTYHQVPYSFYATPLHMAAASGKIEVVKKLLEHNANPNALGKNFLCHSPLSLHLKAFESTILNNEIAVASRYTKWRPLFVPFVMEHGEMIDLLLKSGASPVLAVTEQEEIGTTLEPGSINILHILASQQMREYTDGNNLSYFKKYSDLINMPYPRGEAPLFIALHHGDDDLIRDIIANGGDIEAVSELGRTPLIQAIISFYKGRTPEIRKRYTNIIGYFIKSCHANVGKHPDASVMQTPLTCAVTAFSTVLPTAVSTAWRSAIRDIRSVIDLLLEHGAGLNEISNYGFTVLSALCSVICQREHSGVLLDLFEDLVEDGADMSVLFPDGHSMLGACIAIYNRLPRKFYRLLLRRGATIVPQEVNAVFERWAGCPSFRRSLGFNILQHSEYVTQAAIDSAYRIGINGDEQLFNLLRCHFPNTTVAEKIASEALLHDINHNQRFKAALKFENFNGRYVHSDGNSLLHLIVDRLERDATYKDPQATADARAVLQRGAHVEARDDWGKTPLEKLRDMRQNTAKETKSSCLRLLLYDVKEGKADLWKDYKNKRIDRDQYEQKYMELIDMSS
ncbi:ankyrin repeat-containing domain protein [Trichoderma ceciliae]